MSVKIFGLDDAWWHLPNDPLRQVIRLNFSKYWGEAFADTKLSINSILCAGKTAHASISASMLPPEAQDRIRRAIEAHRATISANVKNPARCEKHMFCGNIRVPAEELERHYAVHDDCKHSSIVHVEIEEYNSRKQRTYRHCGVKCVTCGTIVRCYYDSV